MQQSQHDPLFYQNTFHVEFYRKLGALAWTRKCGRCTGQASAAMLMLLQEHKVTDWIDFMDPFPTMKVNHQFLVIGRSEDSQDVAPATWGGGAVICDPWHGRAYPARDIHQGMYRGPSYQSTTQVTTPQGVRTAKKDLTALRPFKVQPSMIIRARINSQGQPEVQTGKAAFANAN